MQHWPAQFWPCPVSMPCSISAGAPLMALCLDFLDLAFRPSQGRSPGCPWAAQGRSQTALTIGSSWDLRRLASKEMHQHISLEDTWTTFSRIQARANENPETSRNLVFVPTLTKPWTPRDAIIFGIQSHRLIRADRRSGYSVLVNIYVIYLYIYLSVSQAAQSVYPSVHLRIFFLQLNYSTLKSLVKYKSFGRACSFQIISTGRLNSLMHVDAGIPKNHFRFQMERGICTLSSNANQSWVLTDLTVARLRCYKGVPVLCESAKIRVPDLTVPQEQQ